MKHLKVHISKLNETHCKLCQNSILIYNKWSSSTLTHKSTCNEKQQRKRMKDENKIEMMHKGLSALIEFNISWRLKWKHYKYL